MRRNTDTAVSAHLQVNSYCIFVLFARQYRYAPKVVEPCSNGPLCSYVGSAQCGALREINVGRLVSTALTRRGRH